MGEPWRALRLIKVFILILCFGLFFVGKRKAGWPIVSWALYSEYSARFRLPEPTAIDTELRIHTASGDLHVINPEQVLTVPRDSLSHKIIEQAFGESNIELRDASRQYLINAASKLMPEGTSIDRIELWQMVYLVEPFAIPPFRPQNPQSEIMIGSFSEQEIVRID